jgi:hypothetical protein
MTVLITNATILTDGYVNAINITVSPSCKEDDKVYVSRHGWFDSVMVGTFCRVEFVGGKVRFYDYYSNEQVAELG